MVIGLDIDDTITDTFGVMFAYAEKFTIENLKREIKVEHVDDVTNTDYVQAMHGWNNEDELKFFKKYYQTIVEKTTPYFLAVDIINKLKGEGHKIVLITARFDMTTDDGFFDVEAATKKWLQKHGIHYDKLIINAQNKGEVAEQNNVDIFVDDSLKNCLSVASKGIKTFIMDNRCNANSNSELVSRVYTWPHLEQEIRKEIR